MATVIDSLVVSLGLDPKGFEKGQKEAVGALKKTDAQSTQSSKKMQENGKKAAEAFAMVRNQVLALTAAFMGLSAAKSFLEDITIGDAEVGRTAKNVGMAVDEFSAWTGAAGKAGGTTEGMANSIKTLSEQFNDLSMWSGAAGEDVHKALALAGVDQNKFFSKTTSMTEKLLMLSDVFQKMSAPQAQMFGKKIGIDEGTINMLMRGRKAVESLIARQKQINVVTDSDARKAQERKVAWRDLMDTFIHIGRVIVNAVSPAIVGLLTKFENWILKAENVKKISNLFEKFSTLIADLDWSAIGDKISSFLSLVGKLLEELLILADEIERVFGLKSEKKQIEIETKEFQDKAKTDRMLAKAREDTAKTTPTSKKESAAIKDKNTPANKKWATILKDKNSLANKKEPAGIKDKNTSASKKEPTSIIDKNRIHVLSSAQSVQIPPSIRAGDKINKTNTSTVSTHIQNQNIYTNAKDGKEVAQTLNAHLSRFQRTSAAAFGSK